MATNLRQKDLLVVGFWWDWARRRTNMRGLYCPSCAHSETRGPFRLGQLRALNDRKIRMSRGSQWHVSSVANLLARTQKLEAAR